MGWNGGTSMYVAVIAGHAANLQKQAYCCTAATVIYYVCPSMPVTWHEMTAFEGWSKGKVWLCCCNSCITSVQISIAIAWCDTPTHAFTAHVQHSSANFPDDRLQNSAATSQMLSQDMSNLRYILFSSIAVSTERDGHAQ